MGNGRSGGWPAVPIEPTAEERAELERISRQRIALHREVIRARALLMAAADARAIGRAVGVSDRTFFSTLVYHGIAVETPPVPAGAPPADSLAPGTNVSLLPITRPLRMRAALRAARAITAMRARISLEGCPQGGKHPAHGPAVTPS